MKLSRMLSVQKGWPLLAAAALVPISGAQAAILVGGPTNAWSAVEFGSGAVEPANLNPAMAETDIVGDSANPSFYKQFHDGGTPLDLTDGEVGFRVRLGGDAGPVGFGNALRVGMDFDHNGSYDAYYAVAIDSINGLDAAAGGGTAGSDIGLFSLGPGGVSTPSEFLDYLYGPLNLLVAYEVGTPAASPIYDFSAVGPANDPRGPGDPPLDSDLGAVGGTDFFLSFALPFGDLVSAANGLGFAGFDQKTPISMVVLTADNLYQLGQDINGLDGDGGYTITDAIGGTPAASLPYALDGTETVVPEPGWYGLFLGLAAIAAATRLRCRRG